MDNFVRAFSLSLSLEFAFIAANFSSVRGFFFCNCVDNVLDSHLLIGDEV